MEEEKVWIYSNVWRFVINFQLVFREAFIYLERIFFFFLFLFKKIRNKVKFMKKKVKLKERREDGQIKIYSCPKIYKLSYITLTVN